ncbi:MAG TPA: biopolymer transporter ExbD [Vicinamibacterales bacterium]|nr:biopolymer transporter ExbD [Vicinamibacterales bacterium]
MPKVQAPPDVNTGRRRGRRVSTSLSEINVIPLVDVMLVLLIIFMVAAPMLQKGLEVNLPVARRADKLTQANPMYVTVPLSYRTDRRVQIDNEMIPIDVLTERMRQAMIGRDDKEVFLRGDGEVQYQDVMDVFGRLKEAGVQKVGVVVQERRAQ